MCDFLPAGVGKKIAPCSGKGEKAPRARRTKLPRKSSRRERVSRNSATHEVGIVGLGAMGTSIGLALKSAGVTTVGFDVCPANLLRALELGAIGRGLSGMAPFAGCGEIFVAVPPAQVIPVARELLQSTRATVIDIASVKADIAQAIRHPRFVPSHPLRGTHLTGPDAARKDLFAGGIWVLCPNEDTSRRGLAAVESLVRKMGAESLKMDPGKHDVLIATTSHLPHLAASGLVHVLGNRDPIARRLVSGGFLDTTRIARSNPQLWADIAMHNRGELSRSLDELIELLAGVKRALKGQDSEGLTAFFTDANRLMEKGLPVTSRTSHEGPRGVRERIQVLSSSNRGGSSRLVTTAEVLIDPV